ncbi:MAG: drug/metabolite transporter (DMT)-like permease [Gammaproteobacteria bacterium]|jgi:drug/metabolite transporter (DMT)-like permease
MNVALWMIGGLVSLSMMAIGARELAGEITTFQILFFRSVISLIIITLIIYKSKKTRLFSSKRIKLHIVRNVFHFVGQYGWFLGLGLLPLAHVFALEFTVPLWTLVIAALFLKEGITARKVIAVLFGVAGVYVILKPGIEIVDSASIIVLIAAIGYSVSHVTTKALSNTEDTLTVLFYMCLIQLPIGLLLTINDWVFPNLEQWLWLGVVGITALTAHYCITNAMKLTEAGIVVTLDFLRLPLIAVVGVIFYNEAFEVAVILGASLMLFGNLINLKSSKAKRLPIATDQA